MNEIEPITHYLALATIILAAGFMAVVTTGMALYGKTGQGRKEPEYEDGEIDATYYPDDDDSVIFPH